MLRPLLIIFCAWLLSSCIQPRDISTLEQTSPPRATESPHAASTPDYRRPGPLSVTVTNGAVKFDTGRALNYSLFQPAHRETDVLVVVGHGFLRDKERMAGLARHIATWGLDVATLDFRHSRLWAGHHDQNAADMVALARHLNAKRVIFAGFSAGGLSALLAAASDPAAIGYLGLDTVDDGSGAEAAANLPFGIWALVSSPAACNAQGNALQVFAAAKVPARVMLVTDASHCHFEFPMDPMCALLCGKGEQRKSRREIQSSILGLVTASVLYQAGMATDARSWWSGHSDVSATPVKCD